MLSDRGYSMRFGTRITVLLIGTALLLSQGRSTAAAAAAVPSIPTVTARNVLILNRETDRILYEKSGYEQVPMASTTKMMTAIIIVEECTLSETVQVSKTAAAVTGSTMHLAEGEQISVRTLLYGLLLCSGNDAATALAEHCAGSVEDFVDKMNRKAVFLGANNTHFTSPHGLDNDAHYTTAFDLALIADAFLEYPTLAQICSTRQIALEGHSMTNTNPLLGVNPNVFGIKTGYTGNAGYCLVLSARNDSASFIIVLLNCASSDARKSDAQKMTAFAVDHYKLYDIFPRGHIAATLPVRKGSDETVDAVLPQRVRLVLTETERSALRYDFEPCTQEIQAPIPGGSTLGTFRILLGDECLYQSDAVAFRTVERPGFLACLLKVITEFAYLLI